MNHGRSHGCAVYAGIGSDFYIIFKNDDTDLRNFFVSLRGRSETEAVCSDHTSCVQDTIVSYPAIMIYCCIGI